MNEPDVIVVGAGLAGSRRRPTSWSRPAGASSSSTRRTATTSAGRRSGPSAGCSSSTAPSSAGWASRTPTSSRCRTGWARAASTASARTHWPRQWARGVRPVRGDREAPVPARPRPADHADRRLGRARRHGTRARHGNSVPRFHLTWGTGPEVVRVFPEPVLDGERGGLCHVRVPAPGRRADRRGRRRRRRARHRARPTRDLERGRVVAAHRRSGEFELRAPAVVVTLRAASGTTTS